MFSDVTYTYGMQDFGDHIPDDMRGEGNHIVHTPRTPVRDLMDFDENGNVIEDSPNNKFPAKYIHHLEQNQKLPHCCRHPENHHVEIYYSCEDNLRRKVADVHKFICTEQHAIDYRIDEHGNRVEHETRPNREKWHRMFLVEPSHVRTTLR